MKKISISDFSIKEEGINSESKEMKEIIDFIEKYTDRDREEIISLIPQDKTNIVEFKIHNSFNEFSNSIRRILLDEIEVKCLSFDLDKIVTDDKYIVGYDIRNIINSLKIYQDLSKYNFNIEPRIFRGEKIPYQERDKIDHNKKDYIRIKIDVTNTKPGLMQVKSSDIKLYSDDGKNHESIVYDTSLELFHLRPGCRIVISDMYVEIGSPRKDYGRFTLVNSVLSRPLGPPPYNYKNSDDGGKKSIERLDTSFYFKFSVDKHITLKQIFDNILSLAETRLNKMLEAVQEYEKYIKEKNNEIVPKYTGDRLHVTNDINDLSTYYFYNEFITFPYMLGKKIYLTYPDIKYIAYNIVSHEESITFIKINDKDHIKIISEGILNLITDYRDLHVALPTQ